MATKKIYASLIETSNYNLLENLLTNFPNTMTINSKEVEISHVENNNEFITGLFVCTQKKKLPPQHEPGIPTDYTAINLPAGKGLAYPAVFLYIKNLHVILLEQNSGGVTEGTLRKILNQYDSTKVQKIKAAVSKVLYLDGYERLERSRIISTFSINVLEPSRMLARRENDLIKVRDLANSTNASKSIELKFSANPNESLHLSEIAKFINYVRTYASRGESDTVKNCKAKIMYSNEEGELVEEAINLMLDRFNKVISLVEQDENIATIQAEERKLAISDVYYDCRQRLADLIQ